MRSESEGLVGKSSDGGGELLSLAKGVSLALVTGKCGGVVGVENSSVGGDSSTVGKEALGRVAGAWEGNGGCGAGGKDFRKKIDSIKLADDDLAF